MVSHLICADVAQLAEQLICNQQVRGSIPFISSLRTSGLRPNDDMSNSFRVCVDDAFLGVKFI